MGHTVLSLELHPSAVDFSRYPRIDEETLRAHIAAGESALREAGYDIVTCQIPADLDEAERLVRASVAGQAFRVVMLGAGPRVAPEHTLLFERVVNLRNELVPGIVFCFDTSPDTALDALRRWVRPAD